MKKDAPSQVEHLLNQFGRLYVEGVNIDSVKLALPVGYDMDSIYPVPHNTNFLSHLVKWDHQQSWNTPKYEDFLLGAKDDLPANTSRYTIDVGSFDEDTYLTGHQIDGRVLYPATGYLYLIWKTLAKMQGIAELEQLPVVFENVEIHRATILANKEQNNMPTKVTFTVTIAPKNGIFEVVEGDTIVVTGRVYTPEQPIEFETVPQVSWTGRQKTDLMEQEEIYKELRLRGYEYQGEFQPIIKADTEGTQGELLWTGKWIPFLDAMLQMNVLGKRRGLLLPTRIRTIRIDPVQHFKRQTVSRLDELAGKYIKRMIIDRDVQQPGKYSVMPVVYDEYTNTTTSGGVCARATGPPARRAWSVAS
jgi:fatty acid synthase